MFTIDNIIAGGAIGISLSGMTIVFCGLAFISLYIKVLPVILSVIDRLLGLNQTETDEAEQQASSAVEDQEEKDLASVIGLVMQMEEVNAQASQSEEDIDIANVIGLVLHLEQEHLLAVPN